MHLRKLISSLTLVALCAACSDTGTGGLPVDPGTNPQPPINGPDGDAFADPSLGGGTTEPAPPVTPPGTSGSTGNSGSSGGTPPGGGEPPGGSGNPPGGNPPPPGGNPPPGGGGNPAAPVPEPGTMLLFGSGLAGAAWLRRRRNRREGQSD
ncbi:MAG: PEP-CTERM sorting domain-containing protein [Planctomycetes bacterium]|nr:PEP-CTERM sorting domain-containing protein [Planctomycetota bacterium]